MQAQELRGKLQAICAIFECDATPQSQRAVHLLEELMESLPPIPPGAPEKDLGESPLRAALRQRIQQCVSDDGYLRRNHSRPTDISLFVTAGEAVLKEWGANRTTFTIVDLRQLLRRVFNDPSLVVVTPFSQALQKAGLVQRVEGSRDYRPTEHATSLVNGPDALSAEGSPQG